MSLQVVFAFQPGQTGRQRHYVVGLFICPSICSSRRHLFVCYSRLRAMNHNWSARKQRIHLQSVAEISHDSALSEDWTGFDNVGHRWVSTKKTIYIKEEWFRYQGVYYVVRTMPQGHRSVSASRNFLLQAPQCPYYVRKRFSRDQCCRGRSKPGCRIVGSGIDHLSRLPVMPPLTFDRLSPN